MKLCQLLPAIPDQRWTLALQSGVRFAVTKAAAELTGLPAPDDLTSLSQVQQRFEQAGLQLLGLEGDQFDMQRIKWALPGYEEDYQRYCRMLEYMAELGLNLLCYNFMLRKPGATHDWHRTRTDIPLRGGSLTSRFDLADLPTDEQLAPLLLSHEELWANYQRFIEAVMPTAQRCGVVMALHPDDPPIAQLAGVPRIFGTIEAFDRAYEIMPCRSNTVTFCQANFKLMAGRLEEHARHLAPRIAFIHLRDVAGDAQAFTETWHDDGPTDMPGMLRLYHDLGLDVPLRDDHVPTMHGERPDIPGYAALGHLLATGYVRGICQSLKIACE